MEWFALSIVLLIVIIGIVIKLKFSGSSDTTEYPYQKCHALFSPAERSFLGVLDQAVGKEYRVMGKVRIADIVTVKSLKDRRAWQRAFNRIKAKHFDFVLCDKNDLTVAAVIELDDKSHSAAKRQDRDAFLIKLCDVVSLPLIQIPAQATYSIADVKKSILDAMGVSTRMDDAKSTPEHQDAPRCPKCSSVMVRRIIKKGEKAGEEFWGCSTYPKCRGVVPITPRH
ncbi:MAG: DUF2726 domain-containing protein [Desulfoplanes sp.]|nr:DUF2726 domain-containing protein [Desulfoplanes sp.]